MGRSVSIPRGAAVIVYTEAPTAFWCHTCNEQADDCDTCTTCKVAGKKPDIHPDYDLTADIWSEDVQTLADDLRAVFPSLDACDEWLDREDRAFLRNRHAHVSVSEYCGLAAFCLVPVRPEYSDPSALSQHWCSTVEARFRKAVAGVFGDTFHRAGGFSDGTSVYHKDAK